MQERIQKILSARGVASRRQAEEMILSGRVSCNGRICGLGDRADPETDEILVDGKAIPSTQAHMYIMLNKPRGYVTTLSDEKGRKNVAHLVQNCGSRVYPVGRLDMDSDGLLLMTNDGELANMLMHPKNEVNKTYRVVVKGYSDVSFERLRQPIMLDGYKIREPEVALVEATGENAILTVTIHEGRNRQVRRMCAAAGMYVTRLTRISEGTLKLGNLPKGKWRFLSDEEVASLKEHCIPNTDANT